MNIIHGTDRAQSCSIKQMPVKVNAELTNNLASCLWNFTI